jgi:K+-transporting ATPase ATPase C chain
MPRLKDIIGAFAAVLGFTLVLGLAYPLVMTGVSQVVFPTQAGGDRSLVAEPPLHPVARYFQPRPSATGWSATATAFANRGPNSAAAVGFYRGEIARYLRREAPFSPGLTAARIPVDAVTTSASGVDPHISPANAAIQARRVAAVRGLPLARVRALVRAHTDGRFLGLYGSPGVDVRELNATLDKEST